MKYRVIKTFQDKFTKIIHNRGTVYEGDEARGKELQAKGFVGAEIKEKQPEKVVTKPEKPKIVPEGSKKDAKNPESVHVIRQKSGGWYELSDGRTVRKSELPGGD